MYQIIWYTADTPTIGPSPGPSRHIGSNTQTNKSHVSNKQQIDERTFGRKKKVGFQIIHKKEIEMLQTFLRSEKTLVRAEKDLRHGRSRENEPSRLIKAILRLAPRQWSSLPQWNLHRLCSSPQRSKTRKSELINCASRGGVAHRSGL